MNCLKIFYYAWNRNHSQSRKHKHKIWRATLLPITPTPLSAPILCSRSGFRPAIFPLSPAPGCGRSVVVVVGGRVLWRVGTIGHENSITTTHQHPTIERRFLLVNNFLSWNRSFGRKFPHKAIIIETRKRCTTVSQTWRCYFHYVSKTLKFSLLGDSSVDSACNFWTGVVCSIPTRAHLSSRMGR